METKHQIKRVFLTPFNYSVSPRSFEIQTDRLSQTVPSEAISVKDLFQRLLAGIPLPQKESIFNDGDLDSLDMEKVNNLDFSQKQQIAKEMQARTSDLKAQQQEQLKKRSESANENKSATEGS